MGLENRHYFRDGSYTERLTGLGLEFTPVVKKLIIANVIVFVMQIFFVRTGPVEVPEEHKRQFQRQREEIARAREAARKARGLEKKKDAKEEEKEQEREEQEARAWEEAMARARPDARISVVQEWLELSPKKVVEQGQVWRLLTCAFCHHRTHIWHIVFNMLLLYWFGTRLETMYGSREFLLFYLAAAGCSSVAYVALARYTGSNTPAIGASGAVMGIMMLYTIFYPFETFLVFWLLPVPLWVLLGVYVLYDLHPVLLALSGDQIYTGIAHAGHLGGLAFGYVYWKLGLRLESPFDRSKRALRFPRGKTRPVREPSPLVNPRVDDLLRKISEQGQASLTDEERDFLFRESAKYRRKE
jgi:membrane associated rhomboid family serine protease